MTCVDGACADDPCAEDLACDALGMICVPGRECVEDPCVGVTCQDNERCEPVCTEDEGPCEARCVGDWLPGGPPPIQDFCDPDSPIYDEDLCAEVPVEGEGEAGEGEGGDEGIVEPPTGGEGEGEAVDPPVGGGKKSDCSTGADTSSLGLTWVLRR